MSFRLLFTLSLILLSLNSWAETFEYFVKVKSAEIVPVKSKEGWLFKHSPELSKLFNAHDVTLFEPAFPTAKNKTLALTYGLQTSSSTLAGILKESYQHEFPLVEQVPIVSYLYTPNDYFGPPQPGNFHWHLDMIDAVGAWVHSRGDSNTFIGIVEPKGSLYDLQHVDMVGKFAGVDYEWGQVGTGYHGTTVAQLAAGATDNNLDMASIGFNNRLYGITFRSLSQSWSGYGRLLSWSQRGLRIMNMSFELLDYQGYPFYSSTVQTLMNVLRSNGTVVVAGAGNGAHTSSYHYPASHNNVISVATVGPNKSHVKTDGNTYTHNDRVDLTAPGYQVPVTNGPGNYTQGWGSSYAAPLVSGTVGLMLSANPCLSPNDVEHILKTTSQNIDHLPGNQPYQGLLGSGLVQAGAAVAMAKNFQSTTYTSLPLNTGVNIRTYCDAQLNERLEVTGKPNPIYAQHQFNLHKVSDDSLIEVISWWNHSPDGYQPGPYTFSSVITPDEDYYVKRGVWEACTPWQETRVSVSMPSCIDQQNYHLQEEYNHTTGCVIGYRLAGDNMSAIDRVSFSYFTNGSSTPQITWDYADPFVFVPHPLHAATIQAEIFFYNGRAKTVSIQKAACLP